MELDIDSVLKERKFFQKIKCGDDGKKDTPVPISNTEVKLLSADSSWGVSPCEGRTLPRKLCKLGLVPAYFVAIILIFYFKRIFVGSLL